MLVDFDDFCEQEHRLDLLERLRTANPAFRVTLFAIPGLGTDAFWDSVPDWCELAVHGWLHPHPYESAHWSYDEALAVLDNRPQRFVEGFKAPGWQMSDGTYRALLERDWWLADHYDNDGRRPEGLRVHVISPGASSGDDMRHWHGHIGNVCGNGIEETFPRLLERVKQAQTFELMSELLA